MSATIAAIDAWALPYREVNDHGSTRYTALARVTDSDGATGWGEAATIFRGAAEATVALCRSYAEVLAGAPASPTPALAAMREHGWWYGGAGIDSFAVSAIDMALWNLESERSGVPLTGLFAAETGHEARELPRILSVHATRADLDAAAADLVGAARAAGCVGVKVAFGKAGEAALGVDPQRDIRFVKALRRNAGAGFGIMIDVAPRLHWRVDDVLARSGAFEESEVDWIEEPLGDRDPEGYAALRRSTSLRLAYGEREWSPRGVSEILAGGTVDVVGIDPGRVQGVSGYLASTALCAAAGVEANAHAFAGPLIHASASAASAVSPACRVMEIAPERNDLFDLALPGSLGLDVDRVRARAL